MNLEPTTRKTRSAGGVVLNSHGEVLVVSQHGNSWSLPKGHIDPGEDALAAARREIYEEAGVKNLELLGELGTYERPRIGLDPAHDDITELKEITMFLFSTKDERLQPIDLDNPIARWVPKNEVVALLTHPKDREFYLGIRQKLDISAV